LINTPSLTPALTAVGFCRVLQELRVAELYLHFAITNCELFNEDFDDFALVVGRHFQLGDQ
jgi:hypothetical protein